ncbi:MAG TPA: hypothetical protein P5244_14135 [Syntrophales bacterium]|nr:hypothetical protein [Syntrophales bacterium]
MIFSGVNGFDPAMLRGNTGFTGVVEKIGIRGTLEMALRLHPDTDTVAVIVDTTATGIGTLKELRASAPAFSPRIRFDIYNDVRISDLIETTGTF